MLCCDTPRGRHSRRLARYVRTYCVSIATLNQNKRTRLLYLGHTQMIIQSDAIIPLISQLWGPYCRVLYASLVKFEHRVWLELRVSLWKLQMAMQSKDAFRGKFVITNTFRITRCQPNPFLLTLTLTCDKIFDHLLGFSSSVRLRFSFFISFVLKKHRLKFGRTK